jgi:NitT/TauT family transport system substrate-binding protein
MKTMLTFGAAAAIAALFAAGTPARAAEVKFALDWLPQGTTAIWYVAQDRGYFEKEGLTVRIDRGYGSAGAAKALASGSYDIAFGDPNYLTVWNVANPATPAVSVFNLYDKGLAGIVSKASTGIAKPKDLVGKTIAAPEHDAGRQLWPAFAKANGIDPKSVKWITVTPQLRESLLVKGEADAIAAFISGPYFSLPTSGIKTTDIVMFHYAEYGVDIPGNSLITTKKYAAENGDTIKAFVRATIAAVRDVVADPKLAIDTLKKRDALTDVPLETARMKFMMERVILTESVMTNGIGAIDAARMAKATEQMVESFAISAKVDSASLFTNEFLPPKADRMLKPTTN